MPSKRCLRASAQARRNPTNWLREDAYFAGDEARHRGLPVTANPYQAGTEDHADWQQGWSEALPVAHHDNAARAARIAASAAHDAGDVEGAADLAILAQHHDRAAQAAEDAAR